MRIDVMNMNIDDIDRIVEFNRKKGMNYVYVDEVHNLRGCYDNPPPNAKPIDEFFAEIRTKMMERGKVTA